MSSDIKSQGAVSKEVLLTCIVVEEYISPSTNGCSATPHHATSLPTPTVSGHAFSALDILMQASTTFYGTSAHQLACQQMYCILVE